MSLNILLVNPPNSGKDTALEKFGLDAGESIFRGEPLCLETLAGNLVNHDVRILDLKVPGEEMDAALAAFGPDIVAFTSLTCEANTVLSLCRAAKEFSGEIRTVVGGMHCSCDPRFFNRAEVDFVVVGMAKRSFHELVEAINAGDAVDGIPGVAETCPGGELRLEKRRFTVRDLVEELPPRYDLTSAYRDQYYIPSLKVNMGFVATAFGCPNACTFCCVNSVTCGGYITHSIGSVIRDIELLGDIPLIRLVDANTFGDIGRAGELCEAIKNHGLRKHFIVDACVDTIVENRALFEAWKGIGLRGVVIGFEEIDDRTLSDWRKKNTLASIREAIGILRDLGVSIVGNFVVSPGYASEDFDRLGEFIRGSGIDLPVIAVLTPLPGTRLYETAGADVINHDLDYYTFGNAVTRTRLPEEEFYNRLIGLRIEAHAGATL